MEKLDKEVDGYLSKFGDIVKTNSNVDYDLFCKINAENEKRKALSMFLVNLMINKVVSTMKIISLIHSLMGKFSQHVVQDDLYHFTVEISENLFILVSKGFNMIMESDSDAADDIKNKIKNFTKLKVKDTPSLNNKIRFQLLDLVDMI